MSFQMFLDITSTARLAERQKVNDHPRTTPGTGLHLVLLYLFCFDPTKSRHKLSNRVSAFALVRSSLKLMLGRYRAFRNNFAMADIDAVI